MLAGQAVEASKYRAVEFSRPSTLLLGNSRAEMGWDPQSLPQTAFGVVVNAAMPGRSLDSMADIADHAWAVSRPTVLVIGVEFFDCLERAAHAPIPAVGRPPHSRDSDGLAHATARMRGLIEQTLSLDAVVDAARTVWAQHDANAAHLRRDGFNPASEYPAIQRVDGVRKVFLQRDHENARARARGPRSLYYGDGRPSGCFDAVDRLLGTAHVRQQAAYLVTYPYHARLLEVIHAADLWSPYEVWKRMLAAQASGWKAKGLNVSLRDFGAYHTYDRETVPKAGNQTTVPRWYWEAGHFRAELGTRMLRALSQLEPEPLFGVELEPATIESHLKAVRESRDAFRREQPGTVAEIRTLVDQVRRVRAE